MPRHFWLMRSAPIFLKITWRSLVMWSESSRQYSLSKYCFCYMQFVFIQIQFFNQLLKCQYPKSSSQVFITTTSFSKCQLLIKQKCQTVICALNLRLRIANIRSVIYVMHRDLNNPLIYQPVYVSATRDRVIQ